MAEIDVEELREALDSGWLVHKAGMGWYRPEAKGYTAHVSEAGRYSYADALAYSHPNGLDGPRDGLSIKHESELPPPEPDYRTLYLDKCEEVERLKRDAGDLFREYDLATDKWWLDWRQDEGPCGEGWRSEQSHACQERFDIALAALRARLGEGKTDD